MRRCLCCVLTLMILLGLFAGVASPVSAEGLTSSDAFIGVLKKIEGFAQYPYWDNSQWTVGYGTRCPDDKYEHYKANGITEEEALTLLDEMLAEFETAVNEFARSYSLVLSQNQFDALVSFTYNCGTSWMSDTEGYFNRAVREGKTGSEYLYGICLWSSSGGEYILTKRRLSEANMYLNGVYEAYNDSDDGTYPDTYKYVYLDGNGGTVQYIIHGYDAADPVPVVTNFSSVPTGVDASGNTFTYEFAGWYTAETDGSLVEVLEGSLPDGTVLYAQWKDPDGQIVALPKGDVCDSLSVTVTDAVNIRSGPGTFYSILGQLSQGDTITITQTYTHGSMRWGKCEHGWVSLSYTDYDKVLESLEVWPKTGVVNGDYVNVRNGAGTSHPVQYQLNAGDAVTIYERSYAGGLYWGRLDDGNWICLTYVTLDPEDSEDKEDDEDEGAVPGDMNNSGVADKDDAIYLLRHVVYPDKYPLTVSGDVNGSGTVDKDDAIYLLRHVVYPDKYPLTV